MKNPFKKILRVIAVVLMAEPIAVLPFIMLGLIQMEYIQQCLQDGN